MSIEAQDAVPWWTVLQYDEVMRLTEERQQ